MKIKHKVFYYIDGFNLYGAIQNLIKQERSWEALKWCDIPKLIESFITANDILTQGHFFSAFPFFAKDDRQQRHKNYMDVLQNTCSVQIHNGKFKKYGEKSKEKQTDVKLALSVLSDVVLHKPKKVMIVSNDTDFIPIVEFIKIHAPTTEVHFILPPGCEANPDIYQALVQYYQRDKTPFSTTIQGRYLHFITKEHMENSLLQALTNPYT